MARKIATLCLVAATGWLSSVLASDVDALLPSNTVAYFAIDGGAEAKSAWEKSRAHRAIVDSGLAEMLRSLVDAGVSMMMREGGAPPGFEELRPTIDKTIAHILSDGIVVGADIRMLAGEIMIVLPNAAAGGLAGEIDEGVRALCRQAELEVKDEQIEGRQVASVKVETFYLVWWTEGQHLILSGNQLGPMPVLRRVAGKSDNLTKNERYARFHVSKPFVVTGQFWVDVPPLVRLIPSAAFPQLPSMLKSLGVDGLNGVRVTWGFENEWMRTDYDILAPSPRHGLLAMLDAPAVRIDSLPKLPSDVDYVAALSVEPPKMFDAGVQAYLAMLALDRVEPAEFEAEFGKFQEQLGFRIREDLLSALGETLVVYSSPSDGPLGFFGISAAIEVKDRAKLDSTLQRIADQMSRIDPSMSVEKKESEDVTVWMLGIRESFFPLAPTLVMTDKWAVITPFTPAPAVRFARLQTSSGPSWSPSDHWTNVPEHSGTRTGLMYSDPRGMVKTLASLIPFGAAAFRNSYPGVEIDLSKLPDIDTIIEATSPGVAVTSIDEAGWHLSSRYCLPLMGPETGPSGMAFVGAAMAGFAGVGLPYRYQVMEAEQQALEAQRRAIEARKEAIEALPPQIETIEPALPEELPPNLENPDLQIDVDVEAKPENIGLEDPSSPLLEPSIEEVP